MVNTHTACYCCTIITIDVIDSKVVSFVSIDYTVNASVSVTICVAVNCSCDDDVSCLLISSNFSVGSLSNHLCLILHQHPHLCQSVCFFPS